MCKAALERFSTGLAAELYEDNIAVNALSPNRVVPTPGTIFHQLTTADSPDNEPPAVMAEAALLLCQRPADADRPDHLFAGPAGGVRRRRACRRVAAGVPRADGPAGAGNRASRSR